MKKVRKNKKVSETQRSEAQNKHNKERLAPKMERKVNMEDNHFSLKTDFPYRYGGKKKAKHSTQSHNFSKMIV